MIQLKNDYLIFRMSDGKNVPYDVVMVIDDLLSGNSLGENELEKVAATIVDYFETEIGKVFVTIEEFSQVLFTVLTQLGYEVNWIDPKTT